MNSEQLHAFFESFVLMFVLFNPFLMSIYLLDAIKAFDDRTFVSVIFRAFVISGLVFAGFALAGDAIFSRVLQVRFASFLLFGGTAILLIAIRYMLTGASMIGELRGSPGKVAGSIAMPFMIGPGTVSASVFAGARLPIHWAVLSIALALTASCISIYLFKILHDWVKRRNEPLVERYVEIAGRVSALVSGTIAVEMILKGIDLWLAERASVSLFAESPASLSTPGIAEALSTLPF